MRRAKLCCGTGAHSADGLVDCDLHRPQFSLWVLLVPALLFMLWVGHVRPLAALAIFAAACVVGLILLSAFYGFRPAVFVAALANADWMEVGSRQFVSPGVSWLLSSFFLENGLGLLILSAVSLVTFIVWNRTRFFGTLHRC